MFEYELQRLRSDDLIREAEHARLVRETVRKGREARREAAQRSTGSGVPGEDHTHRPRRLRFPRAA
ncbi:hypothetical protein ACFXAZ_20620 [Streptomyces sp. NPDC059477]|uniref:hypothetical protein n=1 Tax=Streptomyces sp. NPDC059477 TaxID=3346847 RepID=UPI0036A0D4C5